MAVVRLALLVRALSLAMLLVLGLAVRYTNFETYLVLQFVWVKEGNIFRAISFFRYWNHLYLIPVAVLGSLMTCKLVSRWLGGRFERALAGTVPAGIFYALTSLFLQELPWSYGVALLLIGLAVSGLAWTAVRRLTGKSPAILDRLFHAYLCFPFVAEVLTPDRALHALYIREELNVRPRRFIRERTSGIAPLYSIVVLAVAIDYAFVIGSINRGQLPDLIKGAKAERIVGGNYHGLQVDKDRNHLLALEQDSERLEVYALDEGSPTKVFEKEMPTAELENIRINPDRGELYHFERGSSTLQAYDLKDLTLRRESVADLAGGGTAQVEYDNASKTIIVTRESDFLWIFDLDTFALVHEHSDQGRGNATIIFSRLLDRYVLSYYDSLDRLRTIGPHGQDYQEIEAPYFNHDLAESEHRQELYVSLPVEGRIAVFDVSDVPHKTRSIDTVFGVRGMAYDAQNDLLLAASMTTGYLDIIDAGSGEVLKRVFVGYYLREIHLHEGRREAFISSRIGGIYRVEY